MRTKRLGCACAIVVGALVGCRSAAPVAWQPRDTDTKSSLRGIAALDADVAWVGGSGGTLLRTDDGGRTWRDVAPPASGGCDFRDVEVLDGRTAVAMVAGQPARVYRTDDGGVSWRVVHEDLRSAAFFDAVAFDGARGVLFGDPLDGAFLLLASEDAGRTWSPVHGALPAPSAEEAAFAASGACVVASGGRHGGFALVTGGGACRHVAFGPGLAPVVSELPLGMRTASSGAFAVAWRGARAVAVGGDYQAPSAARGSAAWTDDGGVTWHAADALGYRSAVLWIDDDRLLAVGSHGASWSPDGGRTWRPFGAVGYHALAKGRDGTVWACGSEGRVARLEVPR